MKIEYIKLKNFRSYGDKEQTFVFPEKGSLLLSAPNGAGKSSLFTGLLFCLFGKSPGNIDALINRKAGKNLKVEVGFSVGSDKYVAQRFREDEKNGDEFYLYKNGDNITSSKKKDTQQMIQDIIGVSYNTMMSSICFTKDNMVHFLAETPTKRLAILDSILNLKEISIWQDKVGEKKTELAQTQQGISNEIDKIDTEVETDSKLIDSCEFEKKEKITAIRNKISENEKKIFEIDKSLDKLLNVDVEKEKMLIENYNEIFFFNANVDRKIKAEEAFLKNVDDELQKYNNNKIKLIDLRKINIDEELAKIDEYEKVIARNKEIEVEILKLQSGIKKLEDEDISEITKLENQISKTKTNICHTCGQPINKEKTDEILRDLNKKLEEEKNKFDEIVKRNNAVLKENEVKAETIQKLESQIKKAVKPDFDRKTIMENKAVIDKISNEQTILLERINSLNESNKQVTERLKALTSEKKQLPSKPNYSIDYIKNVDDQIQNFKEKKTELSAIIKTLKQEGAEIINQKDMTEELKARIKELSEKRVDMNKKYKMNELKLKYFNLMYYLFSNKNDGLKKFIINKMIPMLNESIGKYMNYFFSGSSDLITVSFDKDLNSIIKVNGREVDYNDFSSGERQRLELAVSFSLFFLVKNFFSSQLQFIIIDECLDEALDTEGIKNAIDIINDLSVNNSILLISHRDELKESFDNKISIEKDNKGFSIIKS